MSLFQKSSLTHTSFEMAFVLYKPTSSLPDASSGTALVLYKPTPLNYRQIVLSSHMKTTDSSLEATTVYFKTCSRIFPILFKIWLNFCAISPQFPHSSFKHFLELIRICLIISPKLLQKNLKSWDFRKFFL